MESELTPLVAPGGAEPELAPLHAAGGEAAGVAAPATVAAVFNASREHVRRSPEAERPASVDYEAEWHSGSDLEDS